jgi:hypothetical protein
MAAILLTGTHPAIALGLIHHLGCFFHIAAIIIWAVFFTSINITANTARTNQ